MATVLLLPYRMYSYSYKYIQYIQYYVLYDHTPKANPPINM